jgi:phage tail-like protein
MSADYPPVGFHFRVEFPDVSSADADTRFQSVSGLSATIETETVKEGGENRFSHVLPLRGQYSDLVLKRGVVADSDVIRWFRDAIESLAIEPTTVLVHLLNTEHEPLMTWNVKHAWPTKWSISDFNAESSGLAVETLELQYLYFTRG